VRRGRGWKMFLLWGEKRKVWRRRSNLRTGKPGLEAEHLDKGFGEEARERES